MTQRDEVEVCSGSEMNGLDFFDLVEFAGLPPLKDDEHDLLWGHSNEVDLLEACQSTYVEWQDEDDVEDIPLYTDRYFTVYTADIQKLKEELRKVIQDKLSTPT